MADIKINRYRYFMDRLIERFAFKVVWFLSFNQRFFIASGVIIAILLTAKILTGLGAMISMGILILIAWSLVITFVVRVKVRRIIKNLESLTEAIEVSEVDDGVKNRQVGSLKDDIQMYKKMINWGSDEKFHN